MFGEVPVLPVVIPLGVVLFSVLLGVLRAREGMTIPRVLVAAALSVYVGGIAANTVFPIYLSSPVSDSGPNILPLNLVPIVGYETDDAVTNAVVFVPLGVLVSLLMARPLWWRVLGATSGVSLVIEGLQFVAAGIAAGGHIADINDWLWNTVGGLVGLGCLALATQQPTLAAVVERFRWPSGRQGKITETDTRSKPGPV